MLSLAFICECAPRTITGHNDFSDSVTHEELSVMESIYSSLVSVWESFPLYIFFFSVLFVAMVRRGEGLGGGVMVLVHEHILHCYCSVGLVSWDSVFALIFFPSSAESSVSFHLFKKALFIYSVI